MTTPILTFFNNKGGVGKTSLVYHVAWMLSKTMRVVAADLDPQANLTSAFLDENEIVRVWDEKKTIAKSIEPLVRGIGDIAPPRLEQIDDSLWCLPGDLSLSGFEDSLSEVWPKCMSGDERAFRITSSFWRVMQSAADAVNAEIILIDVGPNLGAINRTALISSDHVVVPLAADLFSLQGLRNLGPAVTRWRKDWSDRIAKNPDRTLSLPAGDIAVLGYIMMQHTERLGRPTRAYEKFANRIPATYRESILDASGDSDPSDPKDDEYCLAFVKHYRSLMPMAQEARKPVFALTPADGAIGAHTSTVLEARDLFKKLANDLLSHMKRKP